MIYLVVTKCGPRFLQHVVVCVEIDTFYVIILVQNRPVLHFPKMLVYLQVSQT